MLKNKIGNLGARLLRAAVGRIATDLELVSVIQAASSSATLVNLLMSEASAYSSRAEVMQAAFDAVTLDGFICELGVYRGQSINEIARRYSAESIHGFDTFTGLPEFWRDGFPEGAFDVSMEKLAFEKNCVLYKGMFDDTLPVFLREIQGPAKLIHVDCDLYSSSIVALRILMPRIQPGAVLVFDEYFNYPGWESHEHRAFREFLELSGLGCRYIAYNKMGQQVAVLITSGT